jgi:hypothetical protein
LTFNIYNEFEVGKIYLQNTIDTKLDRLCTKYDITFNRNTCNKLLTFTRTTIPIGPIVVGAKRLAKINAFRVKGQKIEVEKKFDTLRTDILTRQEIYKD